MPKAYFAQRREKVKINQNMVKIKNEELLKELIGTKRDFPKYVGPLLNLANRYARGTVPSVVGQMTELTKECPEKSYEGWAKWYKNKHPEALNNATEKISEMVDEFKRVLDSIDKKMIKNWVEDLVLDKTYIGLRFQEIIIKRVAGVAKENYRLATPDEEAKGIDGMIGDIPVSVKPITYKIKDALKEQIKAKIIFYEKTKEGLEIDADGVLK